MHIQNVSQKVCFHPSERPVSGVLAIISRPYVSNLQIVHKCVHTCVQAHTNFYHCIKPEVNFRDLVEQGGGMDLRIGGWLNLTRKSGVALVRENGHS